MTPKKKDHFYTIVFAMCIGILVLMFAALISYGMSPDCTIKEWYPAFYESLIKVQGCSYGLKNPLIWFQLANGYTLPWVIGSMLTYALVAYCYVTWKRNYITNKEYGTAKYANVEMICNILKDPNPENEYVYEYIEKPWFMQLFNIRRRCK